MSSDLDALKRIVEAFERSDWEEIDVRWGNLRVHLASTASPSAQAESRQAPTVEPPVAPTGRSPMSSSVEPDGPAAERTAAAPESVAPGAHVVTSPSPGIFWRAPEPGAPPFADIGQTIEPSSTLCIIEVMKLMNHVKAGIEGEVVAIYVENGAAVAKEQPLFAVVGAGGPSS